MPIPSPPVLCTDQLMTRPKVSINVNAEPIIKRPRGVQISVGQIATVRHTMVDQNGDPVNLAPCILGGGSVRARVHDTMLCDPPCPTEILCVVVNPTDPAPGEKGCVDVTLTPELVKKPGVSQIEFAMLDPLDNVIFTNIIYLFINRGQWSPDGLAAGASGPPSIAEIKIHMWDSDPADNLWLGIEEFDIAQIAACTERAVMYWNESQPPIRVYYNTMNFPYRYYWLEAITSCLYRMAAMHYTRTHLPYQQQGGLMIDDKNKAKEYMAIADARWTEFKDFVLRKKVEINAWGAVQMVGSPYYSIQWRGWPTLTEATGTAPP
jgi:hypothetical protein